ncbi:OsmC family protein [Plantactinospora sp. GCM10030261]|uniref:OsmC family protein n=1 Tax=Plantactinospora sp. GCM10030261 TaxID=3273420 RepID=UPI00360855A6
MASNHRYEVTVTWTGNRGGGTSDYRSYDRDHEVTAGDKPALPGSSDPAFRGDAARWNPEELLVASLSQCHMLWYLHLCAADGIVVTDYRDVASGTMAQTPDGGGRFTEVTLRPEVSVAEPGMAERAAALHTRANELCFIARSVNFPVHHEPTIR